MKLPAVLLVLFIGLKLTHNIDWSWWWILSPIWIIIIFAFGWEYIKQFIINK